MREFDFEVALSVDEIRAIYDGRGRYVLVETDGRVKLQLPAANFRRFVTHGGIRGRFRVRIDGDNRIVELHRL